jgi:hypothetical protein
MRWFILLLLLLGLVGAVAKNGCHVREFYGIGYTQHDPTLRHKEMIAWLKNNAPHCKAEDYVVIWNNLPMWAGTADSAETRALVLQGYEEAVKREKK